MRAVVDDLEGTLTRAFAAQVGNALLRDDDVYIVCTVVNVRAERNDGRDLAALCLGLRVEDRDVGVACKVAAAADAVHHLRARDVRRVDVAVDVNLDRRVHRNDAETADDLGVVRDLLRTEHHDLLVLVDVLVEALEPLRRRRECRAGGKLQLARIGKVEHAVLDDLGVDLKVGEVGVHKARDNGVRHVADTRLQRKQSLRHAALGDFLLEEVDRKRTHFTRNVIDRREGTGLVRDVAGNDVFDLFERARDECRADAIARLRDGDRETVRRIERDVDVVHPDELHRLARVHLNDDHVCTLDERRRVADRGRGDDALLRDGDCLHESDVDLAEEALARLLCHLREVHVDVVDLAGVDGVAQRRARLIRETLFDALRLGKRTVQLRPRRGTRPDVDLERILLHALGDGKRNRLRIAGRGKAARTDGHAVGKVLCRRLRTYNTIRQGLRHAIGNIDHRITSLRYSGQHTEHTNHHSTCLMTVIFREH